MSCCRRLSIVLPTRSTTVGAVIISIACTALGLFVSSAGVSRVLWKNDCISALIALPSTVPVAAEIVDAADALRRIHVERVRELLHARHARARPVEVIRHAGDLRDVVGRLRRR